MAMYKFIPLMALLIISAGSTYAADWTPYLSNIKHNCNVEKIHNTLFTDTFANKKLPQALQADLVKRTGKIDQDSASGEVILQLKNATAFGQPLTKISYFVHDNHAVWNFYFANNSFMKLLPTFYAGEGKYIKPAGTQHFWILELEHKDDGGTKVIRAKNQPYKNADKWWEGSLNIVSSKNTVAIGYQTTKDGYIWGSPYGGYVLSFNPKTKTISCENSYS